MKPRPESLYAKLTEDQRAQLHDWILTLGYPKTMERIALALPEGFGINTHLSCLHRFYQRYAAEQDAEQLSEAAQLSLLAPSEMFPLAPAGCPRRRSSPHHRSGKQLRPTEPVGLHSGSQSTKA